MRLADAQLIAEEIRATLAPLCERCEIAGSIRRQRPEIGDIEIVCVRRNRDLPAFIRAVERWQRIKGLPTGLYTQRRHSSGMKLDIFMVTPDTWGLQIAIRTGSAKFSHKVLARGWCAKGYESKGGLLRVRTNDGGGEIIPVREERDLFDLIGIPWREPTDRE